MFPNFPAFDPSAFVDIFDHKLKFRGVTELKMLLFSGYCHKLGDPVLPRGARECVVPVNVVAGDTCGAGKNPGVPACGKPSLFSF